MNMLTSLLVAVSSVGLTVIVLPGKFRYFCSSVGSTVLHPSFHFPPYVSVHFTTSSKMLNLVYLSTSSNVQDLTNWPRSPSWSSANVKLWSSWKWPPLHIYVIYTPSTGIPPTNVSNKKGLKGSVSSRWSKFQNSDSIKNKFFNNNVASKRRS